MMIPINERQATKLRKILNEYEDVDSFDTSFEIICTETGIGQNLLLKIFEPELTKVIDISDYEAW